MISRFSLAGCLLLCSMLAPACWADEGEFEFQAPATAADAGLGAAVRDLAERVLPVYEEQDPERYLANLSALQMVAGDYASADETRQSLRERRKASDPGRLAERALLFDLYAHAKALEAGGTMPFGQAFTLSFREEVPKLNDRDAYTVTGWLGTPLSSLQAALQKSLDQLRAKSGISQPEALDLIWNYLTFDAFRSLAPLVETLGSADESRRYRTEDKMLLKIRGAAPIHIRLVFPRSIANTSARLPALLEFSIFGTNDDAMASAAHGYVGVVAYRFGTEQRRSGLVPFEHDGEDARAVIEWIARQKWSDGRVGMYGGGYSAFAAWAAAKRPPAALKAIATADAMAPGIDFPLAGNIFRNSALRWAADNIQGLADSGEREDAQWRALDLAWYRKGSPYRALDRRLRKPRVSLIFQGWLSHPSYDRYWQKMIPHAEQFAKIDIPVLATTGYYARGQAGSLYYFSQHQHYRPGAEDALLIGPYDDARVQGGRSALLRDYPLDTAALVDLRELRYQWFDHVLKGAVRPALLQDRVNFEVMGANQWRHVPSLAAMADGTLRLYLDAGSADGRHRLVPVLPKAETVLAQTVNLADRGGAQASLAPPSILTKDLAPGQSICYVSEPLKQATEVDGQLAGQLDFTMNKMDLDLNLSLYELLPDGEYLQLSDPYEFRASYAGDRAHRHLLKAGVRQQLPITSERIVSRRLEAGSRLVLVLGVNLRPDRQIDYGTGGDVSAESIADAHVPLKIQWYSSSYVEVPVRR